MSHFNFNLDCVDVSWRNCIEKALSELDASYLKNLQSYNEWLPGPHKIFNAFSLPIDKVQYVLFGESPYPRAESANGYAFWDNAVTDLWSSEGLSKKVNRATSLRNIIKMLLVAEGALKPTETNQVAIAHIDHSDFVDSNTELFQNFIAHGFLLLNATLVLQPHAPAKDARAWQPFLRTILKHLLAHQPEVKFILFGRIANAIQALVDHPHVLFSEHPYNHSFITNQKILSFFKPLHLLRKSN